MKVDPKSKNSTRWSTISKIFNTDFNIQHSPLYACFNRAHLNRREKFVLTY